MSDRCTKCGNFNGTHMSDCPTAYREAISELREHLAASDTARVAAEKMAEHMRDGRDRAVAEVERLRQVVMSSPSAPDASYADVVAQLRAAERGNRRLAKENSEMIQKLLVETNARLEAESRAAPSPSVRAEEWRILGWAWLRPDGTTRGLTFDRPNDEIPGCTVHALYTAPPDLTATLAERDATIAKLKAEVAMLEQTKLVGVIEERDAALTEIARLQARVAEIEGKSTTAILALGREATKLHRQVMRTREDRDALKAERAQHVEVIDQQHAEIASLRAQLDDVDTVVSVGQPMRPSSHANRLDEIKGLRTDAYAWRDRQASAQLDGTRRERGSRGAYVVRSDYGYLSMSESRECIWGDRKDATRFSAGAEVCVVRLKKPKPAVKP